MAMRENAISTRNLNAPELTLFTYLFGQTIHLGHHMCDFTSWLFPEERLWKKQEEIEHDTFLNNDSFHYIVQIGPTSAGFRFSSRQ